MLTDRFVFTFHWSPTYHSKRLSDCPPAGRPNPGNSVKKPWPLPMRIVSMGQFLGLLNLSAGGPSRLGKGPPLAIPRFVALSRDRTIGAIPKNFAKPPPSILLKPTP